MYIFKNNQILDMFYMREGFFQDLCYGTFSNEFYHLIVSFDSPALYLTLKFLAAYESIAVIRIQNHLPSVKSIPR